MSVIEEPSYGHAKCQNINCKNQSYWKVIINEVPTFLCGVHSRKYTSSRIQLKKDSKGKKELIDKKLKRDYELIEKAKKENKEKGVKGNVICSKFFMMRSPLDIEGYIKVFPNFKHGGRTDGIGLPFLSPKSIGPIKHEQPNLPPAKNLENFHQGNKVFNSEVDERGEPKEIFFKTQVEIYNNEIPLRHKASAFDDKGKRTNIPRFSLWVDKQGVKHKISYFVSRQFYCTYYERALLEPESKENKDYEYLKQLIDDGYNLQIIGYDGYEVGEKTLEDCYKDCSRPFGHELVLYSMLTHKNEDWPWKKYKSFDF